MALPGYRLSNAYRLSIPAATARRPSNVCPIETGVWASGCQGASGERWETRRWDSIAAPRDVPAYNARTTCSLGGPHAAWMPETRALPAFLAPRAARVRR